MVHGRVLILWMPVLATRYGTNQMEIPVKSILRLISEEMWHPFYCAQVHRQPSQRTDAAVAMLLSPSHCVPVADSHFGVQYFSILVWVLGDQYYSYSICIAIITW
jgi:cation-transporting ATPase 13A3/4/5